MQATLEDFFKALRGSDLDVALNAQVDAVRAVELVGWHDRQLFKDALGATLAKTLPDRAIFDETFDCFFRFDSFATRQPGHESSGDTEALSVEQAAQGGGVGEPGGEGSGGQSLSQLLLAGDAAALSRRMQQAAREVGLTDIWLFAQKGLYTQKIQKAMGAESLDREISAARQTMAHERHAQLELARQRLFHEVRDFVERKLSMHGKAPTRELHDDLLQTQRLSNIDQRHFARMHELIRKIARRLAERHSHRKRSEQRGQLDFRRTMRANAAYGGVLFETHWRSTVVDRPRVVAICDVSGSVRQFARFLLLLLYSLNELIADVRSFAFTDHLVDVSASFESLPVEQAIDNVIQALSGARTDYGQVLLDIDAQLMNRIDHRSTVLILGDARNNRGEAQVGVMKTLYRRARRVIWLNPEPTSFWGMGDSEMKRYLPYCHIARECSSLRHLERMLDQLLRINSASG
ncbi:MAG: VWA domain-containing protein [Georgfuchsia sp.]